MGSKVWYFMYEDLSEDGIGPISGVMKQLFGAGQLAKVEPVGEVGHYFDQVLLKINVIAATVLPGDVVFLILSGHGRRGNIHIGKPAAALDPQAVRHAFKAAQYRRYKEEGREPDPITVVLILNCCAVDPKLYSRNPRERKLGSIEENRRIDYNCNAQQLGYRWVRWALVRADDGMEVPMSKLLVPALFNAFVEETSFLKALDSRLSEKMQKEASKNQIDKHSFMVKVEGINHWDVDLASKDGQLQMPKIVRTILTLDAQLSSCPPVTCSYQAIQKNKAEQTTVLRRPRELEASANNHGGTTLEQQATENKKHQREDLSGSGRGDDKRRSVKKAQVVKFPNRCLAAVDNEHGQCTRKRASPSGKMCKQHQEMFIKQQLEMF